MAILERLNADLSAAVLGRPEAQQMLFHLERANLFLIPLDDRQYWFRYHHLFADFLERRLRQKFTNAEIAALHRRAAGLIEEALHHLWQAGDFERMAAGLTNRQIADELVIARGTVKKHLDNLYEKLEVHNRTQALARARTLGLIGE